MDTGKCIFGRFRHNTICRENTYIRYALRAGIKEVVGSLLVNPAIAAIVSENSTVFTFSYTKA